MAFSFAISCLGTRDVVSEMKVRVLSSERPYREYLSCSSHGYVLSTGKKYCVDSCFFQLAKITCWMGFSNLVLTRQRHLQFLSLLVHRIARP